MQSFADELEQLRAAAPAAPRSTVFADDLAAVRVGKPPTGGFEDDLTAIRALSPPPRSLAEHDAAEARLREGETPAMKRPPAITVDEAHNFTIGARVTPGDVPLPRDGPIASGSLDRATWDTRADGSAKGDGFLGVLRRPDGKVSSEISIGVSIDGKEVEIPTLVPTLAAQERDWLINNDVSDPSKIPTSIVQKAVAFARQRIAAGKSPFAGADEPPKAQNDGDPRTLSIGGRPYVTGSFTPQELDVIGRSPAAQAFQPPDYRPPTATAPASTWVQPSLTPAADLGLTFPVDAAKQVVSGASVLAGRVAAPLQLPVVSGRAMQRGEGATEPARIGAGQPPAWSIKAWSDETKTAATDVLAGLMGAGAVPAVAAGLVAAPVHALLTGGAIWMAGAGAEKLAELAQGSLVDRRLAKAMAEALVAFGGAKRLVDSIDAAAAVAAKTTATAAQAAARPRLLAGVLRVNPPAAGRASGYGPGEVPGYSGEPTTMDTFERVSERPPSDATLALEESLRHEGSTPQQPAPPSVTAGAAETTTTAPVGFAADLEAVRGTTAPAGFAADLDAARGTSVADAPWTRTRVRDAYIRANPTAGNFDAIAVQNHGETLGTLSETLSQRPWQQAADYGKALYRTTDTRRAAPDNLNDLVQLGAATRAWDREGNVYYGPVGEPVPAHLNAHPDDAWFGTPAAADTTTASSASTTITEGSADALQGAYQGASPAGSGHEDHRAERGAPDEGGPLARGSEGARAGRGGLPPEAENPYEGLTFVRQPAAHAQARLTPEVTRELVRMQEELETFPFVKRTFNERPEDAGYDIVAGAAGAPVYDDILGEAPLGAPRKGKDGKLRVARRVSGGRADVREAIRRVLKSSDIHNHLAEGAVRVAERRAAGDYKGLSAPWLPPSWETPTASHDDIPDDLDQLIDELAAAEQADTARSDTFDTGEEPAQPPAESAGAEKPPINVRVGSTFMVHGEPLVVAPQGENGSAIRNGVVWMVSPERVGQDPMAGEVHTFDVKRLGNLYASGELVPVDALGTGESQPRLPEAGAVRERDVETPTFDAPFSLTGGADTTPHERDADLFGRDEHDMRTPDDDEGGTTLQSTLLPGAAEFVEQDVIPRLKTAADTFVQAGAQLRRAVAPSSVGTGKQAAGTLRAMMAVEAQANAQLEHASRVFQKAFDRLLATRGGRDKAIAWWDAVQTGHPTTILPELKPAYDYMRAELDRERLEVQRVGKLDQFNANYFPQIWKFPREEAQWVLRKIAGLLGRRPLEGSKSFLKRRKYPTFREGLEALRPKGIEPISYNPVDHFKIKMREMRRYTVARQAIEDFKALGIWKAYGGTFGVKPEGWTRIDGPLGTIYGPPTVPMQEAYDPDLFEGLEQLARDLGVKLARRPNIGGKRWGYAVGDAAITTKAAGPETVLMHEIGHILDERYGLWNRIVQPAPREPYTAKRGKHAGETVRRAVKQNPATVRARATIKQELRALADLRFEGLRVGPGFQKYVRENEEKIANLVHAFIYAPERAKEVAPNAYWAVFNLTNDHPELMPLRTLQQTRSLKLGTRSHQIDIGGFPEIGYYAMPDDAARIFNNHLSRGLAGRSAIFDAYRFLNNSMVSGQLAASGMFHLTFTGLDALASQGGLALQEMVGGLEQHKPAMIGRGAKRAAVVLGSGAAGAAAGYAVGGPLGVLWAAGYPLAALKFIKGWRGKRAWLTEDPAGRFFSDQVRVMNEGGFRPTWDEFYDHGAMKNALRALRTGNYPGALARTIPAMLDAVTRPVMSWWVPAMKTANYLDAAAFELERLTTEVGAVETAERRLAEYPSTPKERRGLSREDKAAYAALVAERAGNLAVIRHALNRVQASMDNRFGEVVYDNWFWQRWLKDLAHVVLRSPGWQAGTYKGVVGGLGQQTGRLVAQARRLAEQRRVGGGGRGPGGAAGAPAGGHVEPGSSEESILAADMAWLLALVAMSMLMGGMTHYLSTGERPEGRDWLYPKGPDGKRRTILTYLPRIVSSALHPVRTAVGISAPLNTVLARIFVTNETWSGEVIRETGDSWLQQAQDALTFAVSEGYQPFLAQNVRRGEGTVESLMGVAPAAGEWQRSAAANYLHDILPPQHLTHEQAAHGIARRELRAAVEQRDGGAVAKAAGELGPRAARQAVTSAVRYDPLQRAFERTTLKQAIKAYELATPDERAELKGLFAKKAAALLPQVAASEMAQTVAAFNRAIRLPVASRRTAPSTTNPNPMQRAR